MFHKDKKENNTYANLEECPELETAIPFDYAFKTNKPIFKTSGTRLEIKTAYGNGTQALPLEERMKLITNNPEYRKEQRKAFWKKILRSFICGIGVGLVLFGAMHWISAGSKEEKNTNKE